MALVERRHEAWWDGYVCGQQNSIDRGGGSDDTRLESRLESRFGGCRHLELEECVDHPPRVTRVHAVVLGGSCEQHLGHDNSHNQHSPWQDQTLSTHHSNIDRDWATCGHSHVDSGAVQTSERRWYGE